MLHRVGFSMMFLIPASAFFVAIGGYYVAKKLYPAIGLLDFPKRYGLDRAPIPYPIGIVAVGVFSIYFIFLSSGSMKEYGLLLGILLLAITCFIDDRRPLPSSLRLSIQALVVFCIFASGSRIYTITSPIEGFIKLDQWIVSIPLFGTLPILSGIFTIGWLLLTINAMNWFDGISGQVNIISAIGFLMIGLLAQYRNFEPEVAMLSYTLSAIAGAGTLFDFPPAKVLMGDSGSMFFGLMLGVLGVYQGGKVATAFLAIGIPLIDAVIVILGRISRGSSPFSGGKDHLHHRLLALGLRERTIVCAMACVGTIFGVSALFLSTNKKVIAMLTLSLLLAVTHIIIHRIERRLTLVNQGSTGRSECATSR